MRGSRDAPTSALHDAIFQNETLYLDWLRRTERFVTAERNKAAQVFGIDHDQVAHDNAAQRLAEVMERYAPTYAAKGWVHGPVDGADTVALALELVDDHLAEEAIRTW